jgi:hypothetical protein
MFLFVDNFEQLARETFQKGSLAEYSEGYKG